MERKGWLAIINGKIPVKKRERVITRLKTVNIDAVVTEYPSQATVFAQEAVGYEGLISVGGDGTLNELFNGIEPGSRKISIIPAGTINCLAGFMGVRNLQQGIELYRNGEPRKIDLLSVEITFTDGSILRRYVWGFLTFGRLVSITRLAGRLTWLPKFLRYFLSTFLNQVICRKTRVWLSINNGQEKTVTFSSFILNNATASHFSSIPAWNMQDGTAELQVVNHNHFSQFIASFSRFLKLPFNFSWMNGIRSMHCAFEKPAEMMADGEIFRNISGIGVTVKGGKSEILVPPGRSLSYKIPGFTGKWKKF